MFKDLDWICTISDKLLNARGHVLVIWNRWWGKPGVVNQVFF
jgi:hypothetical protein